VARRFTAALVLLITTGWSVEAAAQTSARPVQTQENCTRASPCTGPQGGVYFITPSEIRSYLPRSESPLHNGFAKRLSRTVAAERTKKATAELSVASWSRARRRHRPVQAKVRSITHRRGWTAKPRWLGFGSTSWTWTDVALATRGPA
jgi:hypothetical protein